MNKQALITTLLALVAMAGQGQIKCHIEGTLDTDVWGDDIIICEAGTDQRVVDDPRFHVKAKGARKRQRQRGYNQSLEIARGVSEITGLPIYNKVARRNAFEGSQTSKGLTLYHDTLINYYPGHPVHEQIAYAEATYRLQPGKPYIDYNVRNTDGKLVPISTLIQGKVALIDLWASWCGPCRQHSIAMIPIYERPKFRSTLI